MNPETRIASYLRREFASNRGGAIIRIECRHYKLNAKEGSEIWATDVAEGPSEDIARDIARECEEDADNRGVGVQRYGVVLFRADKPEKACGPLVLMINAADHKSDGELETEPATALGQIAMTMRHLEATQRMMLGSMAAMMGSQQKTMETVAAENEKLREERIEAMSTIESVFSEKHARDLEAEQSRARTAMLKDGAEKLASLAPLALAHFTGKKSPEMAAAVRVQSVIGDMDDSQKALLVELLTSEKFNAKDTQKIALVDLMQSINDGEGREH